MGKIKEQGFAATKIEGWRNSNCSHLWNENKEIKCDCVWKRERKREVVSVGS